MIIPAILEKRPEEIKRKISLVDGLCEYIQIDIADGKFVTESSYANIEDIASLEPLSKIELHLMTDHPEIYVEESYPSIFKVSAHIESKGIEDFVRKAVTGKYKVGVSVNPDTPIESIDHLPGGINFVQFLTVYPGKQGGEILPKVFEKISKFKEKNPGIKIQLDGGINEGNIEQLLKLGADDVVIGSGIFNSEDPAAMLAKLKEKFI